MGAGVPERAGTMVAHARYEARGRAEVSHRHGSATAEAVRKNVERSRWPATSESKNDRALAGSRSGAGRGPHHGDATASARGTWGRAGLVVARPDGATTPTAIRGSAHRETAATCSSALEAEFVGRAVAAGAAGGHDALEKLRVEAGCRATADRDGRERRARSGGGRRSATKLIRGRRYRAHPLRGHVHQADRRYRARRRGPRPARRFKTADGNEGRFGRVSSSPNRRTGSPSRRLVRVRLPRTGARS